MKIELTCNTDEQALLANVRRNSRLCSKWVRQVEAHDGHAVLVGGGPSLIDYLPSLLARVKHGQTVFALNGAAAFLNNHGVTPDYQVIIDARPQNITLLADAREHLLASQCDPSLIAAVRGPLRIWHPCIEGIEDHIPETEGDLTLIGGGTTVGLSAMCLAYSLGYRNLHLYGFDSSHRENAGHAYAQPQNLDDPLCKITVGGTTFSASLTMAGQAERFPILCDQLIDMGCTITVESDGLIKAVMEETQKQPEAITESEKYRRIWNEPAYRHHAPGEGFAEEFVALCGVKAHHRVIDFGCGTGRGGARIAQITGCDMHLVDFAENAVDPGVRLPLSICDLTQPIRLRGSLGYCTDVMEHIPPEDVPAVIDNIMACVPRCFFKIAMFPDNMGALIGQPLHLSVFPVEWWREHFASYRIVHEAADSGTMLPYATFLIERT